MDDVAARSSGGLVAVGGAARAEFAGEAAAGTAAGGAASGEAGAACPPAAGDGPPTTRAAFAASATTGFAPPPDGKEGARDWETAASASWGMSDGCTDLARVLAPQPIGAMSNRPAGRCWCDWRAETANRMEAVPDAMHIRDELLASLGDEPGARYWSTLRSFIIARLSKKELDAFLRETLNDEQLAMHNAFLRAIVGAAARALPSVRERASAALGARVALGLWGSDRPAVPLVLHQLPTADVPLALPRVFPNRLKVRTPAAAAAGPPAGRARRAPGSAPSCALTTRVCFRALGARKNSSRARARAPAGRVGTCAPAWPGARAQLRVRAAAIALAGAGAASARNHGAAQRARRAA